MVLLRISQNSILHPFIVKAIITRTTKVLLSQVRVVDVWGTCSISPAREQILLSLFECTGAFCCIGNVDLERKRLAMRYTRPEKRANRDFEVILREV